MHFQLGWRNIWRNPRRTTVIMIAVVIGVWSMIFMAGFQRGMINQMVETGITTLTGHIQVHHTGYRNDPSIENSIAEPGVVESVLEKHLPPGALWASRVRVNAVASNARHSGGVT
ncbi:MAG: ABC transporter permease, partial [Deltaproteobacteria bacterium]|nr:ABC transporter permease [Deltaproteobacteria bacterium]